MQSWGRSAKADGRRRPRGRAVACGVAAVALVAVAAGCTAEAEPQAVSTPSSVVLQPGKPGEPAATVAPEDFTGAPVEDDWNEADAAFVTGMIHHHAQALTMTAWVPDRASSEPLRALADRMHNTQGAEIELMSRWLKDHDQPVPQLPENPGKPEGGDGTGPRAPEHHLQDHELMPGMLTEAELAELEAASGAEFDRLFLEGMIKHHRGAIDMCAEVTATGIDQRVQELASNIGVDQQAEIARLEELLAEV